MITTITLELVRHGPLHNQLLSPLTPYIALAGNRPAETVYVPVEHAQMLTHLTRLRVPTDSDDEADGPPGRRSRDFLALADIREASKVVTRFLDSVRGLSDAISEAVADRLNDADTDGDGHTEDEWAAGGGPRRDGVIHLRLIVSANELAMLPFELAQGPLALGGCDMLSALRPPTVVITRDTRRNALHKFRFGSPETYRVLLVAADPLGNGLPLDACLLALRHAHPTYIVQPIANDQEDADVFRDRVTVLPRATLEDLRHELAKGDYSHILVLAHGRMPQSLDGNPSVLFHGSSGSSQVDAVSAERLAATLCSPRVDDGTRHTKPRFVCLMVCDSGNEAGGILFSGGSIAHVIHETGVPLVVASQFPLSFAGAVLTTEIIFHRLLRNQHPTAAVAEARQRLFTELGNTHDWAALVAYATIEDDDVLESAVWDRRFDMLAQGLYQAMKALKDSDDDSTEVARAFQRRLDELQKAFDRAYADGANRSAGPLELDARTAEPGAPTRRRYDAAVIANAFLRLVRLRAAPHPVYKLLSGELPPTMDASKWKGLRESVRSALVDVDWYGRAHIGLGGQSRATYAQMSLALQLLAEGPPHEAPESRARRFEGARRWWFVADWFLTDGFLRASPGQGVSFLDTLLVHLLIRVQIEQWEWDLIDADIRKRILDVADRIVEAYQTRMSKEDIQTLESLAKRLRRYLSEWWGPESHAAGAVQRIAQRWQDNGLPLERFGLDSLLRGGGRNV